MKKVPKAKKVETKTKKTVTRAKKTTAAEKQSNLDKLNLADGKLEVEKVRELEELLGVDGYIDAIGLDEPPVGAEWGINISNDVVGSDDRDYIPDPGYIGESSEISGYYPTYLLFNEADFCATVTTGTP